jgi:hypothetical protein
MICADLLAGANLDNGNPDTLLHSVSRFFKFLPCEQRQAFVRQITAKASSTRSNRKVLAYDSLPSCTKSCDSRYYAETAGGVKVAERWRI